MIRRSLFALVVFGLSASRADGANLIDVNLAMGNLLDLVGQQTNAYQGRR